MIDWAVFRMMKATRVEQQVWTVVSDGVGGWIVHDTLRSRFAFPLGADMKKDATYEKHYFGKHEDAQDYVTFRIHKAGLIAALKFWRRT